jgi:hypothetical protein
MLIKVKINYEDLTFPRFSGHGEIGILEYIKGEEIWKKEEDRTGDMILIS